MQRSEQRSVGFGSKGSALTEGRHSPIVVDSTGKVSVPTVRSRNEAHSQGPQVLQRHVLFHRPKVSFAAAYFARERTLAHPMTTARIGHYRGVLRVAFDSQSPRYKMSEKLQGYDERCMQRGRYE